MCNLGGTKMCNKIVMSRPFTKRTKENQNDSRRIYS